MNKLGQHYDLRNWTGTAVAVGIAGFCAFTGNTGWALFFAGLAVAFEVIKRI